MASMRQLEMDTGSITNDSTNKRCAMGSEPGSGECVVKATDRTVRQVASAAASQPEAATSNQVQEYDATLKEWLADPEVAVAIKRLQEIGMLSAPPVPNERSEVHPVAPETVQDKWACHHCGAMTGEKEGSTYVNYTEKDAWIWCCHTCWASWEQSHQSQNQNGPKQEANTISTSMEGLMPAGSGQQGVGDSHRYDRWLALTPNGKMPTPAQVISLAKTTPASNELLGSTMEALEHTWLYRRDSHDSVQEEIQQSQRRFDSGPLQQGWEGACSRPRGNPRATSCEDFGLDGRVE